jgi:hypothetical protein
MDNACIPTLSAMDKKCDAGLQRTLAPVCHSKIGHPKLFYIIFKSDTLCSRLGFVHKLLDRRKILAGDGPVTSK